MNSYLRSVLLRIAGVVAGGAVWLGLIVLALANFDTPVGFTEELEATWPFWLTALVVTGLVFSLLRRAGAGPGWGSFAIGVIAPFFGLLANASLGDGGGLWFWLPIAVLVLVPLPRMGATA
ncbi:MAG TPA: hypothetical protein VMM14_08685 [Acidimicrobiia bacterium]|nr:hypothetical protein [Acidimicrobiia bacterium]